MNYSSTHEVNESELFKPSLTPDPRCTDGINYGSDVKAIDDMSSKMASFTHA